MSMKNAQRLTFNAQVNEPRTMHLPRRSRRTRSAGQSMPAFVLFVSFVVNMMGIDPRS